MSQETPLLMFFGHHKCASTWIHSVVDAACVDAGWRLAYLYDEKSFGGELGKYVREKNIDFVSYVNADIAYVKDLPAFRGFHVVRDPRDVVVSAYFSHLHSHPTDDWPELVEHRRELQSMSKDEGLLAQMDFNREYLEEMYNWDYDQENILEMKQEELTPDPYRAFLQIFAFLGALDEEHFGKSRQLPFLLQTCVNILYKQRKMFFRRRMPSLPAERLLGIVHDNRFAKYTGGRKEGEEDVKSHYRKGTPGDWKNHFRDEHVEAFKERYNDLLLKLGYEETRNWTVHETVGAR